MNNEYQNQLAKAHAMLAEAKRLNERNQHGAALKQAYDVSEYMAAVYLAFATDRALLPNDASFDLFVKTIREPNRHSDLRQKILETVGDVCVLREAYEPALLDEASSQDAQQMIERVQTLLELVQKR